MDEHASKWSAARTIGERLKEGRVRIVLEGTHSSGKSTLGRRLAQSFGLPFSDEIARTVLARYKTTAAYQGKTDFEIASIQYEIMRNHLNVLEADYADRAAVIDRGPASVYAYSLCKLAESKNTTVKFYLERFRAKVEKHASEPRVLYVLLPPVFEAEDDGVREPQPAKRHMVHYLIEGMLRSHNYPYVTLYANTPDTRMEEALNKIDLFLPTVLRRSEGR